VARVYDLLVRLLLPPTFREEYGAEIVRSVTERLTHAEGVLRRAAVLRREVVDLLVTAIRERWDAARGGRTRAGAGGTSSAKSSGRRWVLESWFADAAYAARRLRRRPGYGLVATLTLALGVGGTAAVSGIARSLLFDPLPYAHEREVGVFWKETDWTEQEFLHLRGRTPGFSQVALFRLRDMTLRVGDAPARLLPAVAASAELFDVLGSTPVLGRGFRAGDDVRGAEPVAVLAHGLWQELGGDPSILGSRLTLDGAQRTVVGVMPRGFWFPDPSVRMWAPVPLDPGTQNWNSTLIGRVAPGRDVREMSAPIARLTAMLDERFDYPVQWDKTVDARITPIRDDIVGGMRPALLATLAAMALILLIACANVAALMLGQLDARSAELAVRLALGANRRRLTQQIVVEAVLIACAAGILGTVLAWGGFHVLGLSLPLGAWRETTAPDWTVFASAMAIALGASVLAALVPTVSLWRGDLRAVLGSARTGGVEGRGGRLENALVVAEVTLAVLIASGAALLVRSVANLYALEPGVRTEQVGVLDVTMSGDMGRRLRLQTIDELTNALAVLPGVRGVAAAQKLPLRDGGYNMPLDIEGRSDLQGASTEYRIVTPGYLEIMGIELHDGRTISTADRSDSEPVVVINEALARAYFPDVNPIGQHVGDGIDGRLTRVIGVVASAAERQLTDAPTPVRYVPLAQLPWADQLQSVVLEAAPGADPVALLDAARRVLERVAPDVALREATTMARVLDVAVGPARQVMMLLSLLAGLALALGAVGIYGVISHFATRRRRDWAVRIALGLPGSRVVAHVVGHGALLVATGIGIGLIAAAGLARLLGSFLHGVGTLDPIAFAAAGGALLAVGVVAALLPALRAGMIDPGIVLREQ
jgi:predicted permease